VLEVRGERLVFGLLPRRCRGVVVVVVVARGAVVECGRIRQRLQSLKDGNLQSITIAPVFWSVGSGVV
jgi:hypothetical protein